MKGLKYSLMILRQLSYKTLRQLSYIHVDYILENKKI